MIATQFIQTEYKDRVKLSVSFDADKMIAE